MKKLFFSFIIIFIVGCGYHSSMFKFSDSIKKENRDRVMKFVKIGHTTNMDILNKYKEPSIKYVFSDGRYSYDYYTSNAESQSAGFLSGVNIVKKRSKYISFIFTSEGKLSKVLYWDDSLGNINKYDTIPQNTIENIDKNDILSVFNNIKIGSKKGHVFRKMGKPITIDNDNEIEKWIYITPFKKKIGKLDSAIQFYLEFEDDILRNKYTCQISYLNDEEKNILMQEKQVVR